MSKKGQNLWGLNTLFCSTNETRTTKLETFLERFVTKVCALRAETKITASNAFNQDHFEIEGNHETDNYKKKT